MRIEDDGRRTDLRDALASPESVTELSLQSSEPVDGSPAIRACPNLTTLSLSAPRVRLDTLKHPKLKRIDITFAKELELPEDPPERLRWFRLGRCAPMRLPAFLSRATSLAHLEIDDTPITTLEGLVRCESLRELVVRGAGLTELPPELAGLPRLEKLDLARNQLTHLPLAQGDFPRLEALSLRANRLTSLPEALGSLATLRSVDVAENAIERLPDAMQELARLETLVVERNAGIQNVLAVAQALGRKKLRALYIRGARLPRGDVQALSAMKRPVVYR
ncbi:MAG: hypothetical protein H6721_29015 [Sandaracinus sp.]|nr:hypothetical protein [Sandaracinus sp.]MCB9613185.1 hypothetical protein [Sandaracinus sp.]MCB9636172.1 hypothetical protein [Sandaracinus sp.]